MHNGCHKPEIIFDGLAVRRHRDAYDDFNNAKPGINNTLDTPKLEAFPLATCQRPASGTRWGAIRIEELLVSYHVDTRGPSSTALVDVELSTNQPLSALPKASSFSSSPLSSFVPNGDDGLAIAQNRALLPHGHALSAYRLLAWLHALDQV
ncbi:hypothetical protein BDZ89DRAFT_1046611 [Hymenopellis radicata]|nr:hypothetical protein BDZ89DRAFT_1046611 [Hymenopellis radicata]